VCRWLQLEQAPIAVQLESTRHLSAQQMAGQPDHKGAEPISPAITIFEVVQQAPRLMELLTPKGVKALTAICTQLRQDFRRSVTTVGQNDQRSGHSHAPCRQVAMLGNDRSQHHIYHW